VDLQQTGPVVVVVVVAYRHYLPYFHFSYYYLLTFIRQNSLVGRFGMPENTSQLVSGPP